VANFPNQWHRKLWIFGFRGLTALPCIDFFLVLQDAAPVIPNFLRCGQPDLLALALGLNGFYGHRGKTSTRGRANDR
jgi:hypothetical protein